jgi:hypothetical protein
MTYRLITTDGIQPPERSPIDRGPKPTFDWIPIANLRVNEAYQRPITRHNISAIRNIATKFQWLKFGALRVAPIQATSPQLYSVIDGQHRATALALLKVAHAPCLISEATEAEQAAAFTAINTSVIRVHTLTAFNASIVAGDPSAMALKQLCESAGVTICPYPIQSSAMNRGQTLAIGTLQSAVKRFGVDALKLALRCISETSNNLPGAVHANAIWALCEIIHAQPRLPSAKAFIPLFEVIELDALDSDARAEKPRYAGDTARARLRDKIKAAVDAAKVAA